MTTSVMSYGLRNTSQRHWIKHVTHYSLQIIVFTVYSLLFTAYCFAEEQTIITSEDLEYDKKTSTYIAKGNVKIYRGDTVVEAEKIEYNELTSEVIATGDVRYNDPDVSFTAIRAELNLEAKTGVLHDAKVLYKKDNYHISGKTIEKKGEEYYFSPEATFTTCDAPIPAWCFKGKDVDALIRDRVQAKDISFRIKNIPVLYAPYFRVPIYTERHTGLLMPDIGYSKLRGFHLAIPFFWAISENRDATFTVDEYTKRGIGTGLEYRYVETGNIEGKWWIYHIRDRELDKDFFEYKILHEQRSAKGIGGFLNINFINEKDFYREFRPHLDLRINRFLESTGEVSLPLKNSRVYFLSQYWVDLKEKMRPAPQKLPEAGYILYPAKVGYFWFTAMATISNFWRDEGVHGQRLDIYPKIFHTLGSDIVISQALGLRETAYVLQRSEADSAPHREAVDYRIMAETRLSKRYGSLVHIVEPSVSYTYIANSENSLPVFDSAELFKETSTVELSLINRLMNKNGEIMVLRASQGFDSNLGDRPFLPFKLEIGIRRPISLRIDANYDVHTGRLESINSNLFMKISKTTISTGQRYNRKNDITFYSAGIGIHPYSPIYMEGKLWYDAKEQEVKDITINLRYISQCWGVNMEFIKNPDDFSLAIMFELRGLGFRRLKG